MWTFYHDGGYTICRKVDMRKFAVCEILDLHNLTSKRVKDYIFRFVAEKQKKQTDQHVFCLMFDLELM